MWVWSRLYCLTVGIFCVVGLNYESVSIVGSHHTQFQNDSPGDNSTKLDEDTRNNLNETFDLNLKSDNNVSLTEFQEEVEQILREEIEDMEEMAKTTLLKIFGLSALRLRDLTKISSFGSPPEFMIDLYNTITDSFGVTRARNPYNAHIVRSYMERNNSLHDYFYFNATSGSVAGGERVLEAELHIHRKPTSHSSLHPSLHMTPFYILSLYEVTNLKYLHVPDLHKLLAVNYVPALGSGWEIFNVSQVVGDWIRGERANLGFLLVATSLSGDRVPVHFSRRGESIDAKQPNLVLFTEDLSMTPLPPFPTVPARLKSKVKSEVLTQNTSKEIDDIVTEEEVDNEVAPVHLSSLENPRFHYALLYKDSIRHPNSINRFRSRRSKNSTETLTEQRNSTSCGKRDLLVNFEAIGWSSWIISPKGYNAFYCDGSCRFPVGQQLHPTNHATVQSIIHQLRLADGVGTPCCVPTSLLPVSLLYYDDHDNVVLRQYVDMVAESCGCH